ncbi:MAG: anhydro-N-acetylmuramic acid kinase [Pegethrix bostrychoides GSE-TBD4-15B]|jgi:anhydro-N-acetylmuramic acid kinase|uniref:Anhydro-N-acetylmuramic acid kinase n=1 Tax=Pegethrix bostrychoides GSE-TBD4-15B TaxID=2839662 RepID=A0A951PEY4_9CYAN|nr:anhydro-N-acetylmuramic acid kinase [Pegethrix bostrychoides GSE-TBD4-15B]
MGRIAVGLISGTSVDGIDAALVELSGSKANLKAELIHGDTYAYSPDLRSKILALCAGELIAMAELATLDDAVAQAFAAAALQVQADAGMDAPQVDLIGSHGQTVFHRPAASDSLGYSLQLGRGALIAKLTGITTISNFRAADIAAGGQGAPLVPPVDACLLGHPQLSRCIQNLGGIGNVAYLPAGCGLELPSEASSKPSSSKILGWDTGPGNSLLDLAAQRFSDGQLQFDRDGAWAATGQICEPLVTQWLQQSFFQALPPKSTGRELFGTEYLDACLQDAAAYRLSEADILASLSELTARSVAESYVQFLPSLPDQIALCGGGSRNLFLQQRLQANLPNCQICATTDLGLNADFKEAIAFAVLAYWRELEIPGNLPAATGARQAVLLGEIHPG